MENNYNNGGLFPVMVDWMELGQRRYNSASMGIDIVYLDVEDKDHEDLARILFRFEKPTGLRYAL